jgi:hypothetical protein
MRSIQKMIAVAILAINLAAPAWSSALSAQPTEITTLTISRSTPAKAAAQAKKQATPEEYYRAAWLLIDQNFAYRDGLSDWSGWQYRYDGKLRTMADAELAIADLLRYVSDDYTYFIPARPATQAANFVGVQYDTIQSGNRKIGYISVDTFRTWFAVQGVREALKALPTVDAYIIDLRNNPGGYVDQATEMVSLFLDEGKICSAKGRSNGAPFVENSVLTRSEIQITENGKIEHLKREPNLSGNKPLAILVNDKSASASEMFAGALQVNQRGIIVGTQTYGKGVMQRSFQFDNGSALNITIAHWYLPDGQSVHWRGIIPDKVVNQSYKGDEQLDQTVQLLQSKLSPAP